MLDHGGHTGDKHTQRPKVSPREDSTVRMRSKLMGGGLLVKWAHHPKLCVCRMWGGPVCVACLVYAGVLVCAHTCMLTHDSMHTWGVLHRCTLVCICDHANTRACLCAPHTQCLCACVCLYTAASMCLCTSVPDGHSLFQHRHKPGL